MWTARGFCNTMKQISIIITIFSIFLTPVFADSRNCSDGDVELWGECYSIQNTTQLELSNSGLEGEIPSEIGLLTNLTGLNLAGNYFTGSIPT